MSIFSARGGLEVERPEVALHEARLRGDAVEDAGREVVEDDDPAARPEEGVRKVGADETGAAGDENGARVGHHGAEDSNGSPKPLPGSFYRKSTAEVARALLGCRLTRRFPDGDRGGP